MPVITPHIPDGLIELMKILAKSVLKEKPENIHEFAAEHFENLLIEQNGSLYKGYEKSKSCEKCLTAKEKVFFEYVLSNRLKLINESSEDASATPGQQCADKKFHPRKLSSKKPSEILLSIKEEDEGTQSASEKEKIAANIIQNAFKSYMKRRQLQENGHKTNESDDMTKEAAAIIIQKALKKYLGDKNVVKNNGTAATKAETSSENNNDQNIDKQIISENVENCTVVNTLEEDKNSQNENVEGEVENVLGESKDVSKANNNDENNEIDQISNTKTHKNSDEDDQQTEDISRQDTLPMDETAEIYKDEIGTQEIGHTNDLAHRNNDKNVIAIERNESVNNANNSEHFATLPEVAQNENELTNKKALWYVGEEPIITSTEETTPSSHADKDLTNLINAKNIINTPESVLSKTLRESKVAANDSIDAPSIYDSLAFNNNQLADSSIEADSLQNISEIKNCLNFVSTETKSIGGEVKGDSIGAELTSDAKPESDEAVAGCSDTDQGHASGSFDAKAEGKLSATDGNDSEDNKNTIMEDVPQMEEKEANINFESETEKEIGKSSESSETKAELATAMIKIDSTEIKDDIEEIKDDSKHSNNDNEGDESATKDENVNEVAENKNINQLDTIAENFQTTAKLISVLPESIDNSEKSGKEDRNVTDNVSPQIVENNEIEKNADSPTGTEEAALEDIDEPSHKVDPVIVSMEKDMSEVASLDHLSNIEMGEAPVTQSNNEIATTSSNEAKIETNLDGLNTTDSSNKDGESNTPEPGIEKAETNMDKLKENTNLNLDMQSSIDTKPLSKETSVEENIVKKVVDPVGRQVSESKGDAKPPAEPISNYNNDIFVDNKLSDGATEPENKSKQEKAKDNDVNAEGSKTIDKDSEALEAQLESESHLQRKLLTEEEISGHQTDESVEISTKDASETIQNKGDKETAKETGQLLQESEVNRQVEGKLEELKSTDKLNESAESDKKGQLDENLTKDENQISTTENAASMEKNIESLENSAKVEEQNEINIESEENQNTNNSVEPSADKGDTYDSVEKSNDENQTNAEEKISSMEDNPKNPKSFTQVQQQRDINGESEEKQNANGNVEPTSLKQDNFETSKSIKGSSVENIEENKVENQTNSEEEIGTVEKTAENPENLTNVQQQKEIDEKCEEQRNANDNIEPTSDKQDTNDNVDSSNALESTENIMENNGKNETNPEEEISTTKENSENLTNVQQQEEEIEINDKIGLAEPNEENNERNSENKENIVPGDKEAENPDKLEEKVNLNKKHEEANDASDIIDNTQPIKEDNKEHILENIGQTTDNNVDEAVDIENAASESNSEITEAKDMNIAKNISKIDDTEDINILPSNETKESSGNDVQTSDEQEITNESDPAKSDHVESANKEQAVNGNVKEEEATKTPSVITTGSFDREEEILKKSSVVEKSPENIGIPINSETAESVGAETEDKEDVKEVAAEDEIQKIQSTNSMADPIPESKSAEEDDELKKDVDNKSATDLKSSNDSEELNMESKLDSSATNNKGDSGDEDEVKVAKPRNYVNKNLVSASKPESGENPDNSEKPSESSETALKESDSIDDKEQSAIQIQKMFRGYVTRKELKNKTISTVSKESEIISTKNDDNPDENEDHKIVDAIEEQQNTLFDGAEEDAALTIQKTFRGHRTRRDLSALIENHKQIEESVTNISDSKQNSLSDDIDKQPDEGKPAIEIQSNGEGVKSTQSPSNEDSISNNETSNEANLIESMKQNTDEPGLSKEDAAMTIQKSFRGYKTRKQFKTANSKEDSSKENDSNQETVTENPTDQEGVAPVIIPKTDDDANLSETMKQNTDEHTLREEDAAMTIQKNYRGYKTRKQFKTTNSKEDSSKENDSNSENETKNSTDEETAAPVTIPKTDDDANQAETMKQNTDEHTLSEEDAAITIQKNYKGYKTRKQFKTRNSKEDSSKESDSIPENETKNSTDEETAAPVTIPKSNDDANQAETMKQNTNDPNLSEEEAAMTIQKNYRGYKTRKQFKTANSKEDSSKESDRTPENVTKNSTDEETVAPVTIPKTDDDANQSDATKQNSDEPTLSEEDAAMTIQKNFRGYKTRKELKTTNSKDDSSKENDSYPETVTKNSTDEETVAPVTITKTGNESTDEANQSETTKQITVEPNLTEEHAATTIQKNYRGYKTRKQFKTSNSEKDSSKENDNNLENIIENLASVTIPKTDTETTDEANQSENMKQNTDEPNLTEEDAAMTIQKNYRGYKTRKQLKTVNSKEDSSKESDNNEETKTENSTDKEAIVPVTIPKTDQAPKICREVDLDSKGEEEPALIEKEEEPYPSSEQNQNEVVSSVNGEVTDLNKTEEKIIEDKLDTAEEQTVSSKNLESSNSVGDKNPESTEQEPNENVSLDKDQEEAAATIQKSYRKYIAGRKLSQEKDDTSTAKEQQSSEKSETANENEETVETNGPTDKNEEDAAVTIQKSYRGYKTRKNLKTDESASSISIDHNLESCILSENIDSEEKNEAQDKDQAALVIQKNYKGYKARQNLKQKPDEEVEEAKSFENQEKTSENISSDIEEKAATTIQKNYKGYKTRKDLTQVKEEDTEKIVLEASLELPQFSEEDAAVTIQRNYKGYKVRKTLKNENKSDGEACQDNDSKTQIDLQSESEQKNITEPAEVKLETQDDSVNTEEISNDTAKLNADKQQEEAALTIQKNYRGYQVRKHKPNEDFTQIERGFDAENSQSQKQKTDEEAALTIQKNYRGYRTRRDVNHKQETDQNCKDVDKSSSDEEKAAIAIQKNFRGYKTRQDLKIGKFPLIESNCDERKRETEVDENESIEQPEEDQEHANENEERLTAKRFSAISDTGLSDAETVRAESRSTINDEISDIENVDLSSYADDSLEGMYYSLRKNEIIFDRMQRRASERKSSLVERQMSGHFDNAMYAPVQPMSVLQKASSAETDEETVPNPSKFEENPIVAASKKNQNFLENMHRSNSQPSQIIESDNEDEALQQESYEDFIESRESTPVRDYPKANSFESPLEATKKESENFLDKLHGTIQDVNQSTIDEDTSAAIRRKMLACSISEADSDYCEVAEERTNAIRDDFNISTALETVTSTDTDSTIISAATKIQAGARGFLTRRRLRRASVGAISTQSEKNASFGNEAIDESLENLIEENTAMKTPHSSRGYMQYKSHTTPSPSPTEETFSSKSKDSNEKVMGITDIKLEHKYNDSQDAEIVKNVSETEKSNSGSMADNERSDDRTRSTSTEDESPIVVNLDELNLAARRLTLQRGDAVQKDSTPEDDAENVAQSQEHVEDEIENSNIQTAADKGKRRRTELMKLFGTRQRTMPVQIDSEILRVIPKHLRKRIKSAEAQKKKRNNLQ